MIIYEDLLKCEKEDIYRYRPVNALNMNFEYLVRSMKRSVSKMIGRNISNQEWENLEDEMIRSNRFMVE